MGKPRWIGAVRELPYGGFMVYASKNSCKLQTAVIEALGFIGNSELYSMKYKDCINLTHYLGRRRLR